MRKLRGFNLLELMLALLVVAAIVFTSVRYFRVSAEQARVVQAIRMIDALASASYAWVEGQRNFENISLDVLIESGCLSRNAYIGNRNNPWHGNVALKPYQKHFVKITLSNVPYSACVKLREQLLMQSASDKNQEKLIAACTEGKNLFWIVF